MSLVPVTGELPATPKAHEAASRIRMAYEVGRGVMKMVEATMMEGFWVIRQEVPGEDFGSFVEQHTPFDREQAGRMVETWRVARKRRDLRELAQQRPDEALQLVAASIDAGVRIEDASDEQVQHILAKPPRVRHSAIKRLIESADRPSPGAEARIEAAEAERDAAVEALQEERKLAGHQSARTAAMVEALQARERELAELSMDAQIALDAETPEPVRERVLALTDSAMESIERIAEAIQREVGA